MLAKCDCCIVDYASVAAIELHDAVPEPLVSVRFKNGTTDPTFHDVPIFGGPASVPLSQFISTLAVCVNELWL